MSHIRAVLTDIGGVLLTNSWDRQSRRRAAERFGIDYGEMDERHHLTFDTYEEGKLSLDRYLRRVVFYMDRDFSPEEFKAFMRDQSKPHDEMLEAMRWVASENDVRMAGITNDTRELVEYRTREFRLHDFLEFVVASCFVHIRKPDDDIFQIALDLAQVSPDEAVYIDDRPMFTEVAGELGIHGVHHRSAVETMEALAGLGLTVPPSGGTI
jgi:putative hydrolase of the HAD superfamily